MKNDSDTYCQVAIALDNLLAKMDNDDEVVIPEGPIEEVVWMTLTGQPDIVPAPKLHRVRIEGKDQPGIAASVTSSLYREHKLDIHYVHVITAQGRFFGKFYFAAHDVTIDLIRATLQPLNDCYRITIEIDHDVIPEEYRTFERRRVSSLDWHCMFVGNQGHLSRCGLRRFRVWGQNEPGIVSKVTELFSKEGVNLVHLVAGFFPRPETDAPCFTATVLFDTTSRWEQLEIALENLSDRNGWECHTDLASNPAEWRFSMNTYFITLYAAADPNTVEEITFIFGRFGIDLRLHSDLSGSRAESGEEAFQCTFSFRAEEDIFVALTEFLTEHSPGDWDWTFTTAEWSFQPLMPRHL